MASPRTGATGGGSGRSRGTGQDGGPDDEEGIPLVRRVGVIAVLVALGGAIVLAAGIGGGSGPTASPTDRPRAGGSPRPSLASPLPSPPAVAPVIATPDVALIAQRVWTASVTIPDTGVPPRTLDLVVYRNGKAVVTQHLRNGKQVSVKNIPLKRGVNKISAALANAGGAGPQSNSVSVTVDDQAPAITVKAPHPGDVLNAASVTVRGSTDDPASPVTVRNSQTGQVVKVTPDSDGSFTADIGLALGPDNVVVSSADALGNRSSTTLGLTRGDGAAHAMLQVTPGSLLIKDLPGKLDIRVSVDDGNGRPVDGAAVTFSVSQPGITTATYDTTTKNGVAELPSVPLARDGAVAGSGFVTVLVTLPDGTIARSSFALAFK
jgi:hypothetical protein